MSYSINPKPLSALALATLLVGCAVQPTPLTVDERRAEIVSQEAAIFGNQEVVNGPISLEEAMARALKYNLDHRLKLMEEAVAQRQLDLSRFDLLPRLTAQAGYVTRDEELASSSENVFTGQQSLAPSVSTDKTRQTADLMFTWNVLDFGVSYFQTQQQADRVLVAEQRRRRVVHMMMQQVRQAYWQALGAQALEGRVESVLASVRQALEDSRSIETERLRSPLETLTYQRQLLDSQRQLEAIQTELRQAKPRLASMMNLDPGSDFELVAPSEFVQPVLPVAPELMEETALLNRPELLEASYNERIGLTETKKALARVMPGLVFELGTHYDSNSYLVHNSWNDAGVRVSWNLLNVLNYRNIRNTAEAQYEVARQQSLALNMAVLTQMHVAYRGYLGQQRQFDLSKELSQVDQRILVHTRNAANVDARGRLQEIHADASALMSELRVYQTYGALQNAYGQVLVSLGVDPLPEQVASHDLAVLQQALGQRENQLQTLGSK